LNAAATLASIALALGASNALAQAATPAVSIAAQVSSPADAADLQVLDGLRRRGADLGKPHTPVYFTRFPTEAAQKAAHKEFEADGFRVLRSSPAKDGKAWSLLLTRTMPLSIDNVANASRSIAAVTARFGGHYDGWEADPRK
jgi:hypothetical protein